MDDGELWMLVAVGCDDGGGGGGECGLDVVADFVDCVHSIWGPMT